MDFFERVDFGVADFFEDPAVGRDLFFAVRGLDLAFLLRRSL